MSVPALQPTLDVVARSVIPGAAGRSDSRSAATSREPSGESALRVEISARGRQIAARADAARPGRTPIENAAPTNAGKPDDSLSAEDKQEIEKLERRDREVRAHEAAHKAAAGSLSSGGPSFTFTSGPDGKRYATSGEVSIDTSAVSGDPDATVRKMQQVRAAALAPASPSAQDRRVAARATATAQSARSEKAAETADAPLSPTSDSNASLEKPTPNRNSPEAPRATCSVCGGEGHGPEGHDRENTPAVDLAV